MSAPELPTTDRRGRPPIAPAPSRQRLAFEAGMADTRRALRGWLDGRLTVALPWAAGALAVGAALLGAALGVAELSHPGPQPVLPVFADPWADAGDAVRIAADNSLVLLLHCLICVGTYLAVRSVPIQARRREGADRLLRDLARPAALVTLAGFTVFSFATQAIHLGHALAGAARTLEYSEPALLVRLALHAVPELTGIFLPLAAGLSLIRARRYDDLLAAAVLSGLLALPLLVLAACCEVWVTRLLL